MESLSLTGAGGCLSSSLKRTKAQLEISGEHTVIVKMKLKIGNQAERENALNKRNSFQLIQKN